MLNIIHHPGETSKPAPARTKDQGPRTLDQGLWTRAQGYRHKQTQSRQQHHYQFLPGQVRVSQVEILSTVWPGCSNKWGALWVLESMSLRQIGLKKMAHKNKKYLRIKFKIFVKSFDLLLIYISSAFKLKSFYF